MTFEEKNLFCDVYLACKSCLEGGFISKEKAFILLKFLEQETVVCSIFPNNLLYALLKNYCFDIPSDIDYEFLLIEFITDVYLSSVPSGSIILPQHVFLRVHTVFSDLYDRFLFDKLSNDITFQRKSFGFSSKLDGFTKKQLAQLIRERGGGFVDPNPSLDYFFIGGQITYQDNIVTNKCADAIRYRRIYGNPLIFRQVDWFALLDRTS